VHGCIPIDQVSLVCAMLPPNYLFSLMNFIQKQISEAKDIEWNLVWLQHLLKFNEPIL
jgi:hypothetical protein